MQPKNKAAGKGEGSKIARTAEGTSPSEVAPTKRKGRTPKSVKSPPPDQEDLSGPDPAPPRRGDIAQRRRIDEAFRSLGYQVDDFGEAGRSIYPPGIPVRVLDPDSSPSMVEELIVTIGRSLRNMREDGPILQYDKIMEILLDWMKRQGPLRPSDYSRVYAEFNLRELYNQIYNPGGRFPQLCCCVCGQILKDRQGKYCSPTCKKANQTQKYRSEHPEHKARRKA